jgi:hypothetical protein
VIGVIVQRHSPNFCLLGQVSAHLSPYAGYDTLHRRLGLTSLTKVAHGNARDSLQPVPTLLSLAVRLLPMPIVVMCVFGINSSLSHYRLTTSQVTLSGLFFGETLVVIVMFFTLFVALKDSRLLTTNPSRRFIPAVIVGGLGQAFVLLLSVPVLVHGARGVTPSDGGLVVLLALTLLLGVFWVFGVIWTAHIEGAWGKSEGSTKTT